MKLRAAEILIVDDDAGLAGTLRDFLEREGYAAAVARALFARPDQPGHQMHALVAEHARVFQRGVHAFPEFALAPRQRGEIRHAAHAVDLLRARLDHGHGGGVEPLAQDGAQDHAPRVHPRRDAHDGDRRRGEQPGDVEDRRGIPFVGPAGPLICSIVTPR